jgi:hypothetical protein
VIAEQLIIERLLEAICFDWCFKLRQLFAGFVIGLVMSPFSFGLDCFIDVWRAAELREA